MSLRSALGSVSAVVLMLGAFAAQAAVLSAPGGGAIHALVVGVNDYPNLGGSSLRGARPDAEDIAAVLTKDGVKDVTLLRDREVTRAAFVTQMNRLVADSKPGDLVFISYSGHGMEVPEYPRWKGLDPEAVNQQIVLSGFSFKGAGAREVVVNVEVRAWLSRLDAKGVDTVVVWDSCFGGGMRSVFGGEIKLRQISGKMDDEAGPPLTGIEPTAAEARTDVKTLSHVTFLAGATAHSVVPEMEHVDLDNPKVPRGALSYYVARALEGRLKQSGEVTRADLFPFLKQGVRQATADRQQEIQLSPQNPRDPTVSHRTVFVIASDERKEAADQPISIGIQNGNADTFATIVKGATPIVASDDPAHADIRWDVAAGQAFTQGDMLMENIDGSLIGSMADRVRAVNRLRAVGESRPLIVRREPAGALMTPSSGGTDIYVEGLQGLHLVVFNIGADATVQMIQPASEGAALQCPEPASEIWKCHLGVVPPFGIDTLFAVATARDTSGLITWLHQHDGKRDAAQLPELIRSLLAEDSSARVGFVPVTTRAKSN